MLSPLESEAAFNEYRVHRLHENKTKLITSEYFVVPVPIYKRIEKPAGSGKFVKMYVGFSEVKLAVTVDWVALAYDMGVKAARAQKRKCRTANGAVKAKIEE